MVLSALGQCVDICNDAHVVLANTANCSCTMYLLVELMKNSNIVTDFCHSETDLSD